MAQVDRVAEDWHAKLWLDDVDSVALYRKVWNMLRESAVYGARRPQRDQRGPAGV